MAEFRKMHNFVQHVRDYNNVHEKDEIEQPLFEDKSYLRWMKRRNAISDYVESHKVSHERASEVYEDTIKFNYLHPHEVKYQDKRLKVTPEGRHFLKKVWIFKTGMWRAWADDSKNLSSLVIAFIGGIILGTISVTIAIISLHKP